MRKDERGSAMIVVLCIMAAVIGMALALLHTAAMISRSYKSGNQKEQCRILAVSVSECVITALEKMEYTSEEEGSRAETWMDLEFELENDLTAVPGNATGDVASESEWAPEVGETAGKWIAQTKFQEALEEAAVSGRNKLTCRLDESAGLPGTTMISMELDMDENAFYPDDALLYLRVTTTIGDDSYTVVSILQFEEIRKTEEGRAEEGRTAEEQNAEEQNAEERTAEERTAEERTTEERTAEEQTEDAQTEEEQENGGKGETESGAEKERRTGHWKYRGRGVVMG